MPFTEFVAASANRSYFTPRRGISIGAVALLHAGGIAALFLAGAYHVDELSAPTFLGPVIFAPPPAPADKPATAKQPGSKHIKAPTPRKNAALPAAVLPTATPPENPAAKEVPTETVEPPSGAGNNARNPGTAAAADPCPAGGACNGGGDGNGTQPGENIGGDTRILPAVVGQRRCIACANPSVPPQLLAVAGEMRFDARICVTQVGAVSSVDVLRGISPALDAQILETLHAWRYAPHTVAGRPVPFCYQVNFLFRSQ